MIVKLNRVGALRMHAKSARILRRVLDSRVNLLSLRLQLKLGVKNYND